MTDTRAIVCMEFTVYGSGEEEVVQDSAGRYLEDRFQRELAGEQLGLVQVTTAWWPHDHLRDGRRSMGGAMDTRTTVRLLFDVYGGGDADAVEHEAGRLLQNRIGQDVVGRVAHSDPWAGIDIARCGFVPRSSPDADPG
jgi:hypothetical protein